MKPSELTFEIERFWYRPGRCYVLNEGYAHDANGEFYWLIRWLSRDGLPSDTSDLLPLADLEPIWDETGH